MYGKFPLFDAYPWYIRVMLFFVPTQYGRRGYEGDVKLGFKKLFGKYYIVSEETL